MSVSQTQNRIIPYLWGWAEQNNNWGKLLVSKVIESGRVLTVEERGEIYELFTKDVGLVNEDIVIPNITCPDVQFVDNNIKLKRICEIKGVNKLAEDQSLEFSNNLTVVYGENGTGKSGYGRILNFFANCYDKKKTIFPNIYADSVVEQSVKIVYDKDDAQIEYTWSADSLNTDLEGISAFNNNCVEISLGDRELLVKPSGFNLFTRLSVELTALNEINKGKLNEIELPPLNLNNLLSEGSVYHNYINSISHESDLAELERISDFTEGDDETLVAKRKELLGLNEEVLKNNLGIYQLQINDIGSAIAKVVRAKNNFDLDDWNVLLSLLKEEKDILEKGQIGLEEVVKSMGVEESASPEFLSFIKTADAYLKKINKSNYPESKDDVCIYCRQKLEDFHAFELLSNYNKVLNDETQVKLVGVQSRIASLVRRFAFVQNIYLSQATCGLDENNDIIQPEVLIDYNQKFQNMSKDLAKARRSTVAQGDVIPETAQEVLTSFLINYDNVLGGLRSMEKDLTTLKNTTSSTILQIAPKSNLLKNGIKLLEEKKLFSEKKTDIKKCVELLNKKNKYTIACSSFGTASLSRKTTQAREAIVTDEFKSKFRSELQNIKPFAIDINFNFKTERGDSILSQNINQQYKLSDILSEGEQKTIALAEFLSEIQIDDKKLPVVFDDPVTSLDHQVTWEIAKRIVKLSGDRQVVVFTHSLILLNDIKQISEQEVFRGLQYKYYRTEKNATESGLLSPEPSVREDRYNKYRGEINSLLNVPREERTRRDNELAIEGYGKLRAAIEVLVEDAIFNQTIKRHRRSVSLTKMEAVNGSLIDEHKEAINTIFERCCRSIEAHSDTEELGQEPNLETFEIDFRAIEDISQAFAGN